MTTVADILDVLEALAPTGMKMDWDNVGLLCGSRKKEVEQVLVALDPFEDVCDEAVEWGADVIVTHHPLIFRPVANVTDETSVGRIIERLCSAGICAVNAHTNLDCAPGGVNDELAAVLGLRSVTVLNPSGTDAQGRPWGLLRGGETDEQPLGEFLQTVRPSAVPACAMWTAESPSAALPWAAGAAPTRCWRRWRRDVTRSSRRTCAITSSGMRTTSG